MLDEKDGEGVASALTVADEAALLKHCATTVAEGLAGLEQAVDAARATASAKDAAAPSVLLDAAAARLLFGCSLLEDAHRDLNGALDHLEAQLYAQLRDAVGKELQPADFDASRGGAENPRPSVLPRPSSGRPPRRG